MKNLFATLIIILLAAPLLTYGQDGPQRSPINPDYANHQATKNNQTKFSSEGYPLGEMPSPTLKFYDPHYSSAFNGAKFAPNYDLRNVNGGAYLSPVRDQGLEGACWSFATYGAIESYWLKNGMGQEDFSEQNLATCHGFDWSPSEGGNYDLSMAYLSRRSGPIDETDDPYTLPSNPGCVAGLTPTAYIDEARFLPGIEDAGYSADIVKQALLDNGALYVNMNYDSDYLNGSDETYYYNGTEGTNHAVLLVGWDDNKVVTGGIATPSSTGAWIIRNSWGPSWGESGYFYISYEDTKALKSVAYFPTTQTYNSESSVYSYDELGWCTSIGYSDGDDRALTKFTATGNQEIQSIGTFVNTANCNIDIYIYGSFTGSSLGNLLGSITSQTCEWPGYYSFDLASPVSISNGSDFYVVVRYSNCGDYPIPVESAIADYSSTATFETGKCWISNTGSSWLPIGSGTDYAYDAGIKVYATDIASVAPDANFTASQTIVSVGQTVNFTDLSTGVPDSWDWTFEGAQTISSSDQHPSAVWTTPGTYDISLTASNSFGFDTETKTDYITVTSVPMTCDTMSNMQEDDNLTYYTVGDYGFVSGHNSYLMNQFAEYYEAPVHNNLTGLTVAVAKADAMSGNAIISMKVWDNVGGFPGNELYSEDFNITDFTAQSYNNIDFTTGVDVPNEFFIGYEVYYETPMDTFAVYQAQARPSTSTHDSTAFVKYNNNWYNLGGLFSDGFNSSYSIEPILCPAAPTANFIADQTEGCESLTVQFTDMSTGNAEDWSWDFGDGNTSTEQNPEHMYSSPGQYTVSLTVSNVIGEDTFTQTNLIQVFTNPTVNLGTDTDFCEGGSVSLNAGTGMTQYNWSPSGTGQTVEANTAGTWSVTVTDSHGCTASDNINLTELTAPSIDLGSDMTVCDTEIPVILDAGSGMASYIWSPSGDSQTISVNTSGTYSVIVEGSNGCTSSDQIEVSVLQTPVPGFSPSYIELCDYDAPVTLDPGTGSLYNYSWSNGSDSETIEVTESGNYTVTVSAGSCSAEASIDVHVETSPIAFNLLGGGQIDEGTGAEIYLSGEEDDVSYYLNHETDGIVATELSGDHSFGSFTTAGTYTAYAVSDTANCTTDMNGEVEIIITNLSEFTLSPIEVFPNPATTYLNIQSGQTIKKISFYAMDGKCIKSVENPDQYINIEDLPSGNFLIHIQTKETTIIKNLIVN